MVEGPATRMPSQGRRRCADLPQCLPRTRMRFCSTDSSLTVWGEGRGGSAGVGKLGDQRGLHESGRDGGVQRRFQGPVPDMATGPRDPSPHPPPATHHRVPVLADGARQVLLAALRADPGHLVHLGVLAQGVHLAEREQGPLSGGGGRRLWVPSPRAPDPRQSKARPLGPRPVEKSPAP